MPRTAFKEFGRSWACLVLLLAFGSAAAQGLSGTFVGESPNGPVEVQLQESAGDLTGVLTAAGARFELEGWVDDGVGAGFAYDDQGSVGFEAHIQGDTLGLYLFEVDAAGEVVEESVIELIMTRRGGPGGAVGGQNPLQPPPAAPARDPFAAPAAPAADPLAGTFADERLTLTIEATSPGAYTGRVASPGGEFVLSVFASREGLVGSFESGGESYTFDAVLEGDTMIFQTAGNVYRLARVGRSGPVDPFAAPASPGSQAPPPRGGAPSAAASSPVIARGAHGDLRQDDALAFIEALEFVLGQVGYPYQFSEAERTELLTSIAQAYPYGSQMDQAAMAQARQIWRNVQANWSRSSVAEQREFALGVLVLAFGEATVRQWVGPGGGGGGGQALGGGGSCQTFEDCTSSFVDEETWTDTFNAQGCWGAAGCTGYDAGSNTLTFDSYD